MECVTLDIEEVCSHRKFWTILERKFFQGEAVPGEEDLRKRYEETAFRILAAESPERLDAIVPVVRFGKLSLVERFEIEDFLALYHTFLHYSGESEAERRPLNIAVFGPPGVGKTRGVKEIAPASLALPAWAVPWNFDFPSPEPSQLILTLLPDALSTRTPPEF